MGVVKYTIEDVCTYVKENSKCKLLSVEFINANSLLEFQCDCGNIFSKSFYKFKRVKKKCCSECKLRLNEKRLDYEYVKKYIENNNCILISNEYDGVAKKLEIKCICGNTFYTSFQVFKNMNKNRCDDCTTNKIRNERNFSYEFVKEYLKMNTKFTLLSNDYINARLKIKLQCECGEIEEKTFADIRGRNIKCCKKCNKRLQHETLFYENITSLLFENNLEFICFIGEEDIKTTRNTRFIVKCKNNHILEKDIGALRNKNNERHCKKCYGLDNKGSNNHVFTGKKTLYEFCRTFLDEWKQSSMVVCDYKCVVTGDVFNEIHHLFSFHKIIDRLIEELGIPIYESINLYSNEELLQIEKKCLELHGYYGLGVCLRKDVHRLFHSIYGAKNNTPEQFEEFKNNYINNKFESSKGVA